MEVEPVRIDLEESRPAKAMFSGLAVFFSFAVLFGLETKKYSIVEMLILWLGTLAFVRFGAKEAFFRFSYHRGVWHSLLALVFCSLVTAWVFYNLLGRHESVAWLAAVFMGVGFLTGNTCSPGTGMCVIAHELAHQWWGDLVTGASKPIVDRGYITVPDAPGLGIELNEPVVKEHIRKGGYFEPTPQYDDYILDRFRRGGPYPHIDENGKMVVKE